MKKLAYASALIAVIALSAAWTGLMVYRQRPALPVAGLLHRSTVDPTVDRGGHSRGEFVRRAVLSGLRSTRKAPGMLLGLFFRRSLIAIAAIGLDLILRSFFS